MKTVTAAAFVLACSTAFAIAQGNVPVTVDNFARAESDLYMGNAVKDDGFGKFHHNRTPTGIDRQLVIRMNRDTLYSAAVFDLDAGPVTITMPDAGPRFMSMQVIDEDHNVPAVFYGPGSHTLSTDQVGTRYAFVAIRTLVDPSDPKDLDESEKQLDMARCLATACDARPLLAFCDTTLSSIHARRDHQGRAREFEAAATAIYRELGMQPLPLGPWGSADGVSSGFSRRGNHAE